MTWLLLIGVLGIATIATLVYIRRERRLTFVQETLRCPLHDCAATVGLRTDPIAHPPRRYVDVTRCSLLPSTCFVLPTRTASFSDVSLCDPYPYAVSESPSHRHQLACSKGCLPMLNAAEHPPGTDAILCTSGVSDGIELVRQTQSPAITRLLWFHSA